MRILTSCRERLEHAILHTNTFMEIIIGLFINSKIIRWNRLEWNTFPGKKKIIVTEKEGEKVSLDCN